VFPADLFSDPENSQAVIIGNLMDRSVANHVARERSVQLAADQINSVGGLSREPPRPVGVVFCTIEDDSEENRFDGLERQEAAIASARFLAEDLEVPAIVGPAGSGDTEAVFTQLRQTGTVVISPSATSPALTELEPDASSGNPGRLWRTPPPDSLQGRTIAEDMEARGVENVAVIAAEGAYGTGLATVFQSAFGGTSELLVFSEASQIPNRAVMAGTMSEVDEVLFISSQADENAAFLNSAATEAGFEGKGIFLPDAGANVSVLDSADPSVFPQIRGTRPQAPGGTVFSTFRASYRSEFDEDVTQFTFTAHAYDAAWLAFLGSAWAVFQEDELWPTGEGVALGIRHVAVGSEGADITFQVDSWNAALTNLRGGEDIDVIGASGNLDYDPVTEETSAPIEVWVIDDDQQITPVDVGQSRSDAL
jgi:branched-chain amino acid transport system substrate-binding protein